MVSYSREMQQNPTASEASALCLLEANSEKVEAQVVFGFYILDLVIPAKMVCIEIDGASHNGRQQYDRRRDNFIKRHGLKVLRFFPSQLDQMQQAIKSLPVVADHAEKWRMAQDRANTVKSKDTIESLSKVGRGDKTKRFYTPKREQAHVLDAKRRRAHLSLINADSPADVAARKAERERNRQNIQAKLIKP